MNKNDVYRIIGYHGEYNADVKKALRKLLKENHPDNKGDRKKFELINEVKKELENGKVSYTEKKIVKDKNNIDYDYCNKMINILKVKKNSLTEQINTKKELLNDSEREYETLYKKSLELENNLLVNSPYIKKIQKFKQLSIILIVLLLFVFALSIIKNSNILFIVFLLLALLSIFIVQRYMFLVHKINEMSKKRIESYLKVNIDLKKNMRKQNSVKKEIREIKRKLVSVENDLRFYRNLLK